MAKRSNAESPAITAPSRSSGTIFGPSEGAFSGGAGEEQFSSFLMREHAGLLAERLDLGFAAMLEGRA